MAATWAHMRRLLAIAVIPSALLACPAWAEDSPGLAPSSPWTVDYAEDRCSLRRTFGPAEDSVSLEFQRFAVNGTLRTMVASKRLNANLTSRFQYRFGQIGEWRDAIAPTTLTSENRLRGVAFDSSLEPMFQVARLRDIPTADDINKAAIYPTELEMAAQVDTFALRGAFREELTLKTGPLAVPIQALNECVDDLMAQLGLDEEEPAPLTRRATPLNFDRIGMQAFTDLPTEMFRRKMSGAAHVRLDVDERGVVTGCRIHLPVTDTAYEERRCAILRRGLKFEPALDAEGKPVSSYWTTTVNFNSNN